MAFGGVAIFLGCGESELRSQDRGCLGPGLRHLIAFGGPIKIVPDGTVAGRPAARLDRAIDLGGDGFPRFAGGTRRSAASVNSRINLGLGTDMADRHSRTGRQTGRFAQPFGRVKNVGHAAWQSNGYATRGGLDCPPNVSFAWFAFVRSVRHVDPANAANANETITAKIEDANRFHAIGETIRIASKLAYLMGGS